MPGVGQQRERVRCHAVESLRQDVARVQRNADGERFAKARRRMHMAADAVGVAMGIVFVRVMTMMAVSVVMLVAGHQRGAPAAVDSLTMILYCYMNRCSDDEVVRRELDDVNHRQPGY